MATQDNLTYGFDKPTAEVLRDKASETGLVTFRRPQHACAYFWAPEGGIPAATTSTTAITAGAANCYKAIMTDFGVYEKSTDTYRVENIVPFVVGANGLPIKATRNEYGCYTVDVEDCS